MINKTKTKTELACGVVDKLLSENDEVKRSILIKGVESELGLNNATNIVGSMLDRGVKKGKYLKVSKATYSLNKGYVDVKEIENSYVYDLIKLNTKVTKVLNTMSTSLLNAHIDGDLDESELSKYKVLKNISTLLDACVSYSTDSDLVALKGVIEGLK